MKTLIVFLLLFVFPLSSVFAQASEDDRAMNQPVEPFKIIDNIYYVGASDITSYLITTPQGHILIDAGFEETVPQIQANVTKLGFKLSDVKILLLNHAHYDHCGGMAEMKRLTGAKLMVSPPDAKLLEDGGASDFYFRRPTFKPVKVDQILKNGELIKLGGVTLKTHFTFGHTKGATSWTTTVRDNGKKLNVVFMSSMTTLDYKLFNNAGYPEIADDFARTFRVFKSLKPDVLLAAHGQFFDLLEKAEKLRAGAKPNPFIDPVGYRELVVAMSKRFEDRLAADKAATAK